MTKEFDLQMFAELDIQGIDSDILKELGEELPTEVQEAEVKETEQTPNDVSSAEADSDNKQVEEHEDEYEDVKEGQTIPYERFKSVNDRRKQAESLQKEHEATIEELKKKLKEVENKAVQKPDTNDISFDKDQLDKISQIALENVRKKMNLTDEDIEAMEYADDVSGTAKKTIYAKAVEDETKAVMADVRSYLQAQQAVSNEFSALEAKMNAYTDIAERWEYIANERFNQLPRRKQTVLKNALLKLQGNVGTDIDLELVSDYIETCNHDWEAKKAQAKEQAPVTEPYKPNNNNKILQAQKLPKAPNLNGASGGDTPLTVERVTEIVNNAEEWEKLSDAEKKAILNGVLP